MAPVAKAFPATKLWQLRVERARFLESRISASAGVLRFYAEIFEFQAGLAQSANQALEVDVLLRRQIDVGSALSSFPALLLICVKSAPGLLAEEAKSLASSGGLRWREILQSTLASPAEPYERTSFFARACLQPLAEALQAQLPADPNCSRSTCPACGGLPQLSILRPEAEGGIRSLQCSFCLREWTFRRVVCAGCGEQDKDRLPSFSADEFAHVRVSACDVCKRYLKSVDMTLDGRAVPLVDEVAATALDVWAAEQGYTKIAANLMGF